MGNTTETTSGAPVIEFMSGVDAEAKRGIVMLKWSGPESGAISSGDARRIAADLNKAAASADWETAIIRAIEPMLGSEKAVEIMSMIGTRHDELMRINDAEDAAAVIMRAEESARVDAAAQAFLRFLADGNEPNTEAAEGNDPS